MTGRQALKEAKRASRQAGRDVTTRWGKGSHLKIYVGDCVTTIPMHQGEDLGRGIQRAIERDLEPCLGKRWLRH